MIGIIVLYGISTSFLNIEYWNIKASDPAYQPSKGEMEAIDAFKEILDNDPKTWLATITSTSATMATFAAPADQLVLKQLLYTAYRPEMAFTQLYRHPAYDHAYIYLHDRDFILLNKLNDRFLANYIKLLPIAYENSEVKIYNLSKVSPPISSSDAVLILPLDKSLSDEQNVLIAYSLLSQGLYNYTAAYDLDDEAFNSETIILSYDPPEACVLTGSWKDNFDETLAPYTIMGGSWLIADQQLLGGEVGKYGEGIMLSKISAENFTASIKVRPINGDTTALNYVSLIYSWKDSKNFRYADILFNRDLHVYVLFRTVSNGIEKALPNWPGIKTDLKWNFGEEYNITINVNGALNQISINRKPYLSIELENLPGRVGLRYYRFHQVSFDDFSINYSVSLNIRPIEDYLNFLKSGRKLIVLNTNGYNYIASSLFSEGNSTFSAMKIEGVNVALDLPEDVIVPKLALKNTTVWVVSRYIGLNAEAPFIVKQNYGEGELIYVNINPVIEAIRKGVNPSTYYKLLDSILEDLNLPKIERILTLRTDGYVKEIQLKISSKIETTSLIFPTKTALKQVEIQTSNGSITISNINNVKIKNYARLSINAENITISNGQGFYATLTLSNFTIQSEGIPIDIEVGTEESKYSISRVERISITPHDSIQLLARTPKVRASQATFIEFYTLGLLQERTRTYGQNLNVNATTSFQIMLSDSYTMLENVEISGSFERQPPPVMLDELSTIPKAMFWILLLLPIFIGVILISTLKRQTQIDKGESST
jgi:hypothetical protein